MPLRLVLLSLWLHSTLAAAPAPLQFNRDIRPILSEKCFQCHGPDPKKRDSGLRLDVGEEAIKERKGIRAIVPGQPDSSEVILRVTSHDDDELMPPAKAKMAALTSEEIATLRRWISEGAYEKHWAFNSSNRPKPLTSTISSPKAWPSAGSPSSPKPTPPPSSAASRSTSRVFRHA